MTEKKTLKDIELERIPLHSWPPYFIQEHMGLDRKQSGLLNNLLIKGVVKYDDPDINISIFNRILKNSTPKRMNYRIGTFFILDFYNHWKHQSEEFINCYRDDYFYPEFTQEIVDIVRPLEEAEILTTPEQFFSTLLVSSLKHDNVRDTTIERIHKGMDCKETLLSVINKKNSHNF